MEDCSGVTTVPILKYQALGNDFLIALDPAGMPGAAELDRDFVVAICDRHRGVGADGVIVLRRARAGAGEAGTAPRFAMELRNADGGRPETSGNGLRCLALALLDEGLAPGPDVVVETDAGPRAVTLLDRRDSVTASLRSDMGQATVGRVGPAPLLGERWSARCVEIGNPHLVMIGPSIDGVDIASLGRSLDEAEPGGRNVEVVAPDGCGGLDLVVWERGAGVTRSCGTGSCAAAAAARDAGTVGSRVSVRNPGGTLVVDLTGDDFSAPSVLLSGPATRVFRVDLRPLEIEALL